MNNLYLFPKFIGEDDSDLEHRCIDCQLLPNDIHIISFIYNPKKISRFYYFLRLIRKYMSLFSIFRK